MLSKLLVPKIDWMDELPQKCYRHKSTYLHEIKKWNVPVYICENHAAAIKGWYKHRMTRPTLITFDHHTDTKEPFVCYAVNSNNTGEKWVRFLNEIKSNIDNLSIDDFFKSGAILKKQPLRNVSKLQNTEHITTALYLDIIDRAFVCTPETCSHEGMTAPNEIVNIYHKIKYLNALLVPQLNTQYFADRSPLAVAAVKILKCMHLDLRNVTLMPMVEFAFQNNNNYILDIDLDYFQHPFFDNLVHSDYTLLFRLIRNAKAITIATEKRCVKERSNCYNSCVADYNNHAKSLGCPVIHKRPWTSEEALCGVLSLIEYELGGNRAQMERAAL